MQCSHMFYFYFEFNFFIIILFFYFNLGFCNNLIYCILWLTALGFCCCIACCCNCIICIYYYLFLFLFFFFVVIYFIWLYLFSDTAYYNYLFCNRAEALPVSLAAITASASLLQFRMEMRLPCTEIVEINALGDEKPIESHLNYLTFAHSKRRQLAIKAEKLI